MSIEPNILIYIVAQLATAAGVYAAIRADLRECTVRISIIEKVQEKHASSCNSRP